MYKNYYSEHILQIKSITKEIKARMCTKSQNKKFLVFDSQKNDFCKKGMLDLQVQKFPSNS